MGVGPDGPLFNGAVGLEVFRETPEKGYHLHTLQEKITGLGFIERDHPSAYKKSDRGSRTRGKNRLGLPHRVCLQSVSQ